MSATYTDLISPPLVGLTVRPKASPTIADALSRLASPLAIAGALRIVSNASTAIHRRDQDFMAIYAGDSATFNASARRVRSVSELGWTVEQAAAMRHRLSAFADDWNDPAMDAYDAL